MAKIKFGMMMTDARGKLGGQVFSKNKSGNYVRTKTTPTNPQTVYQSMARALFASISANWSGLSDAVRASFDAAVPDWKRTNIFGDLTELTGKALFQRLNNQAQSAGLPAVLTVPTKITMPDAIVTDGVIDISSTDITLTDAYATAGINVVIMATPPLTQGTKFVKNRLRQIYSVDAGSYVAADAYAAYVEKFGAPTAGDNVYLGIKYVAPTGQVTPMQTIKATVQA